MALGGWLSSGPEQWKRGTLHLCRLRRIAGRLRIKSLSAILSSYLSGRGFLRIVADPLPQRASEVRSARYKASAFSDSQNGTASVEPVERKSSIASSIHKIPLAVSPEALRAQPRKMAPWVHAPSTAI